MPPVIRISDELYDRLAKRAEGFDTPANVIEGLLDDAEGVKRSKSRKSQRDMTKYNFNGNTYGKGRLVLAVISEYVSQRPKISLADLYRAFPMQLRDPHGPFIPLSDAMATFEEEGRKRNFIDAGEPIELRDGLFAISNQWGIKRMGPFLENAERLGIEIQEAA